MTSQLTFHATPLAGLIVVQRNPITDDRGYLERLFCAKEFASQKNQLSIVQANRTLTARKGTVRGMHFQYPPHTETKLVSCLAGKVFDVAIDLRRHSSTFLRWHAEELSSENRKSLLIPAGFAHGLQTLEDGCELLYFHSSAYAPEAEGGIRPSDPKIGVAWPLPIAEMSPRDRGHPALANDFKGIAL
jgi:dTDP-4-dehydrorhamnose 3,5-epimerase